MSPFVKGPEKGSSASNTAVIILTIKKLKRGYYKGNFELITTTPRELAPGTITKTMIACIEKAIQEQPSNYLWSHRRWKWEFDESKYGKLVV